MQRLGEWFEMIKNEFESVAQDSGHWKAQKEDYEAQSGSLSWTIGITDMRADGLSPVTQQINELGMIRKTLYELEATHAKVRQE